MAVKASWSAGDVLTAADLTDTFGAKAPLASPTFTGTVDMTGATVLGVSGGLTYITKADFSSAASVSVNTCFTTTYDNYRVIVSLVGSTTGIDLQWRLRVGGADDATATSYATERIVINGTTVTGSYTTSTAWLIGALSDAASYSALDLINPATAARSLFGSQSWAGGTGAQTAQHQTGHHTVASSFDGFSLIASTGTITGTVYVYGYRKA